MEGLLSTGPILSSLYLDDCVGVFAVHSPMIPANSRSCSSSRYIKKFQMDLRFIHSLNGFIHHSFKINFVLKKEKEEKKL